MFAWWGRTVYRYRYIVIAVMVALCLAGGVAANSQLRERILDACVADGLHGFLPSRSMCTDNAAMVAAAAWWRLQSDGPSPLDVGASPNLRLPLLDG